MEGDLPGAGLIQPEIYVFAIAAGHSSSSGTGSPGILNASINYLLLPGALTKHIADAWIHIHA